jgi:hypothetical protein
MAQTPAVIFNFSGKKPYAEDQTAETVTDSDGTTHLEYHAHKIKQGSSLSVIFNWPGIVVDDYAYAAHFRRGFGSGPTLQATAAFVNSGTEQVTMSVTAADLADGSFENGSGFWDLEATHTTSGLVDRWVQGSYDVTPEVTA